MTTYRTPYAEVQAFADVNVAWLSKVLSAAGVTDASESE
jgi:hypothetical protein